jgi:hypothetical protein
VGSETIFLVFSEPELTLSKRKEELFSVGLLRSGKIVSLIGTASLFIVLSFWKNSSGPLAVCVDIVRNGSNNFFKVDGNEK